MENGTFVANEERLRRLVATLAAQNAQLERALESRVLIEQAKGMLAERWDVAPERGSSSSAAPPVAPDAVHDSRSRARVEDDAARARGVSPR